jgi:GAF domain-containing protein
MTTSRTATTQREHADLLYETSLEFNSTLDLDELLPRLFDRVLDILDAEAGSIWLCRNSSVVCHLARGPASERLKDLELPLGAGIVGDIARRGESELVGDVRHDPRFIHQVDEATGFATRSMLAAPLKAQDQVLGVFQLLNKRSGTGQFDERDMALLNGLGATAGLALRNAQLHVAEKEARDLKSLLRISQEITSTLDVDRLVLSVVNLGSQALPYDRAAIALDRGGRLSLQAISGQKPGEMNADDVRDFERLIPWLAEKDVLTYVSDIESQDDMATALRENFAEYLDRSGARSICVARLEDEEGRLGTLYLESKELDAFLEVEREQLGLLANQTTVALRNAQLYDQVPFIGVVERVGGWKRQLVGTGGRPLLRRLGIQAAVVTAILLVPWGVRVKPPETVLLPGERTPVRATVAGLIDEVRIEEGKEVSAGQILAVLRADDLSIESQEAAAALAVARRDAAAAQSRGNPGAAQVAELKAREMESRLAVIGERRNRTFLKARHAGVVLTPRPREMVGRWLREGETFVTLGRTDRLETESRVDQRDIGRVSEGQEIRVRTSARPEYTFVGAVTKIAAHADSVPMSEPTFLVRAEIDNTEGLLRPGMEAKAKIVAGLRPIGWLMLRPVVNWTRMRMWR